VVLEEEEPSSCLPNIDLSLSILVVGFEVELVCFVVFGMGDGVGGRRGAAGLEAATSRHYANLETGVTLELQHNSTRHTTHAETGSDLLHL
jgi:hypothetical protein